MAARARWLTGFWPPISPCAIRVILAGWLDARDVARAIQRVKPRAVDVSSGVETERRKDPDKIRALHSRRAGAALAGVLAP